RCLFWSCNRERRQEPAICLFAAVSLRGTWVFLLSRCRAVVKQAKPLTKKPYIFLLIYTLMVVKKQYLQHRAFLREKVQTHDIYPYDLTILRTLCSYPEFFKAIELALHQLRSHADPRQRCVNVARF